MKSLRGQLLFFWILLFGMCAALAVVMLTLYRSSAGAQVAAGRSATEQSCRAIAARYAKSATPDASVSPAKPQVDLLQVLLQLALIEAPHVEGGVWQAAGGQLAYAYPTYEGSGVKRDVPAAEQPLIVEMAQLAARTQQPQTDVVRGSREALIVSACPLVTPANDLAAWTMTRTNGGALAAQGSLRTGLGVLLVLVLASGLWLGFILLRGCAMCSAWNAAWRGPTPTGVPCPSCRAPACKSSTASSTASTITASASRKPAPTCVTPRSSAAATSGWPRWAA
ncbi:hypothetical protein [Variovorax sp. E3]|uniref:hypothetical protein n=1 Tax=Variovorax sp. E3 TaxID=1914993 RepID=UPI0022B74FB0|nr:hypothetical protein [Variovorax sp. E3]